MFDNYQLQEMRGRGEPVPVERVPVGAHGREVFVDPREGQRSESKNYSIRVQAMALMFRSIQREAKRSQAPVHRVAEHPVASRIFASVMNSSPRYAMAVNRFFADASEAVRGEKLTSMPYMWVNGDAPRHALQWAEGHSLGDSVDELVANAERLGVEEPEQTVGYFVHETLQGYLR